MLDPRPVFYVIGLLTVLLGLFMLPPMAVDLYDADPNWRSFALSSFVTVIVGAAVTLVCRQARRPGLSIHQIFLLTTLTWAVLPVFAAIPLMTGAPAASLADGVFEAMSGLTTTGSTVFAGLDYLPRGTLLWRGLLQWMGGVGIIVVALAFLPTMKVGGMQFFRSEGFDTLGKILPRAAEIALSISWIYLVLT
ncbi:MAG: TrkH family potassium uptake protein, partial [Alphaproteobacteria bacterium]